MEDFKEEVVHKLIGTPASYKEQSKLIKYLKILKPDSDPTWECIRAYHCWLEDIMWKVQGDHHAKAVEAAKSRSNGRFSMVETDERQLFVANITSVLSNKLQSFWKLSSSYNTSDSRWTQHQEDINMMLTNTLNAASWLILNALIPELLPPEKTQMYASKFVKWPEVSPKLRSIVLVNCLKTIRGFISTLLECQFSNYQIQPLLEISMMIRMKVIANVIEKTIDNIQMLYKKENWQQEFFDSGVSKTPLPDLYENEVCECISSIRDALATNGYPGESCLFSKEQYRSELIRFFVEVLRSIKKCIEILLGQRKVPIKLQDHTKWDDEENTQITPRKLLISICNLEYVMESSLTNISKRMNDSGIKYADVIFEHSRKILGDYRRILIEEMYIRMKLQMFQELVESCNYDYIPGEDVSDYAKEMMMCFVLQQAELELHSPQMTLDCIQMTVQRVIEILLGHISASPPKTTSAIQQCVIDLCALEENLDSYMTLQTRTHLNNFRAGMIGAVDQQMTPEDVLQIKNCLEAMQHSLQTICNSIRTINTILERAMEEKPTGHGDTGLIYDSRTYPIRHGVSSPVDHVRGEILQHDSNEFEASDPDVRATGSRPHFVENVEDIAHTALPKKKKTRWPWSR